MLTTVILEGAMGKTFGRKWKFAINSPREALAMIEANKPGLKNWIRNNLEEFPAYRVTCEYEDGRTEDLETNEYELQRKLKSIRFSPVVRGASHALKIVLGIVILVVNFIWFGNSVVGMQIGASLILSGVIGMLSPQPKRDDDNQLNSNYFDGPTNTTSQGVPVPLIYGTQVLVGSHNISAKMDIAQVLNPPTPAPSTGTAATTGYLYRGGLVTDSNGSIVNLQGIRGRN